MDAARARPPVDQRFLFFLAGLAAGFAAAFAVEDALTLLATAFFADVFAGGDFAAGTFADAVFAASFA